MLEKLSDELEAPNNVQKVDIDNNIDLKNYINKAKGFFNDTHKNMIVANHSEHDDNPAYWDILLYDIKNNPQSWNGKNALDFGCGCGRNIRNLISLANWERVDGCDISIHNAEYSKKYIKENSPESKCGTWENTGYNIYPIDTIEGHQQKYDFIMSTITLVHIPIWEVRFNILKSMYNALNENGMLSISMSDLEDSVEYYENYYDFPKNCRVENPKFIYKDLQEIGFKNITIDSATSFENRRWYFAKAIK